ncbi:thioredoxin-like protein [Trametes versicolor FP-101664 SS1]|uniref:thioredoxin-like protein n=1 Tax=Trametes versicolor (strain FP-101664) TaxID=717944 RepID=UPI0004621F0C|nr:thioredoxin-like protein [Trametes versicolor FP-101664 SS1]EIW59515.1 thioredoxin-like protein [Trametes versicolor FP-101664 SS1]
MSQEHHFTLYTHTHGPNGWKVVIVLEELGLDYDSKYLVFDKGEQKSPEYTKYNPNGRIPTLIDHKNDDFVIWESGAIITYLAEKYDPEGKISATSFEGKIQQLQWLMFQASGQGFVAFPIRSEPYFGQVGWFMRYHPEKIPSAIERYQKEVLRVLGVLNDVLSKQEWLVGDKCTVADLSLIPWNVYALMDGGLLKDREVNFEADYPAFYKWHQAMVNRHTVKKIYAIRETFKA